MKDIQFKITGIEFPVLETIKLTLTADQKLHSITAGQFLQLEVPDNSLILRRPFCIYDYDDYSVVLYIAVTGKGTQALENSKIGDTLKAILPLGNGFNVDKYKNIGILGGGMGCAPLFRITKDFKDKNFFAYLGFNSKNRVLFFDDYEKTCKKLVITTADGTAYEKGFALDYIKKDLLQLDAIIMCGPHGLVKAAREAFKDIAIPVFVSLEERMACGVGACLVCTCPIIMENGQTNKRVCADGPIFNLQEVVV